jgi:hypothetical protein
MIQRQYPTVLVAFLLALALFGLGGCGESGSNNGNNSDGDTAAGKAGPPAAIPAAVLSNDTVAAVHIQADKLNDAALDGTVKFVTDPLPDGGGAWLQQQLNRAMGQVKKQRDALREAGVQAALLQVALGVESRQSPRGPASQPEEAPQLAVAIKTGPDADKQQLLKQILMIQASPDMAQQMVNSGNVPFTLSRATDDGEATWYAVTPSSKRGPPLFTPRGADEAPARRMNQTLARGGDRALRVAVRPTPKAIDTIRQQMRPRAQALPDFLTSGDVKAYTLAFQPGQTPTLALNVQCKNETVANNVSRAVQGRLSTLLGKLAARGPATQPRRGLSDQQVKKITSTLAFEQSGDSLSLTLGAEEWQTLEQPIIDTLVPAVTAARQASLRMENSSNMHNIVMALISYSTDHGDLPQAQDPAERFETLLNGDYITPEVLINPLDEDKTPATKNADGEYEVTTQNYSYALLDVNSPEWANTLNSRAPLVADRNTATDENPASLWNPDGPWEGTVGWGDGHADYQHSPVLTTKVVEDLFQRDHLFRLERGKDGEVPNDIHLIYQPADAEQ